MEEGNKEGNFYPQFYKNYINGMENIYGQPEQ